MEWASERVTISSRERPLAAKLSRREVALKNGEVEEGSFSGKSHSAIAAAGGDGVLDVATFASLSSSPSLHHPTSPSPSFLSPLFLPLCTEIRNTRRQRRAGDFSKERWFQRFFREVVATPRRRGRRFNSHINARGFDYHEFELDRVKRWIGFRHGSDP